MPFRLGSIWPGTLGPWSRPAPNHLEHTLIGDAVSLAGRLANLDSLGTIIISGTVRATVPDQIGACPPAPALMKGRAQPLVIYELTVLRG